MIENEKLINKRRVFCEKFLNFTTMLPKMRILTIFAILLPVVLTAISNGDVPLHKNANISQLIAEHMKMLNLKMDPLSNQSESEVFNYKNMLRIKDVLDVFSITNLAENWNTLRSEFTSNCSEDMTHYFNGMSIGRMWAAKSKSINVLHFPFHVTKNFGILFIVP